MISGLFAPRSEAQYYRNSDAPGREIPREMQLPLFFRGAALSCARDIGILTSIPSFPCYLTSIRFVGRYRIL